MGATAFVPEGYEVAVVNGRRVLQPKHPESWKHRSDGHGASKKVWLCRACWTMHYAKAGVCINAECQHTHFEKCDSHGEATWLVGLVRRLERGEIADLVPHPTYRLHAMGPGGLVHVRNYIADAEYVEDGTIIVADFKPRLNKNATTKRKREAMLDPTWILKRDWFEAEYGRPVTVVTN